MERILTKEEIAELLSAVHSGEIETETGPGPAEPERPVKPLDLIRTSINSGRWQNANFDVILDAFARTHGNSLTSRLQRPVAIKRRAVEAVEFDPFLLQLGENGAIGIIRLDPLSHGGLFVFDSTFSYILVEMMLGGSIGMEPLIPDRPLTTIEMNLVKSVMEGTCTDLRKAFAPLEALSASLIKVESDPRLVNIVPQDTEMMVVTFDVSIDAVAASMNVVIPYSSLEPLREKVKEGIFDIKAKPGNSWTHTLKRMVTTMEVEVAAQLGELSLPIKEILDLQTGDIIDLDYDPNTPMRVLVEKKHKFLALAGIRNGKKTVHITGNLVETEENDNI